jgi:hypothetical protein
MFVDVIAVQMVQVPIMEIVDMVEVANRRVAAALTVGVGMFRVHFAWI